MRKTRSFDLAANRKLARGFTLVELLVVIAVIVVLACTLLPALSRVQTRARASKCLNNLKQIGTGTAIYEADMNDKLPYAYLHLADEADNAARIWSWDDLLHTYMGGQLTLDQLSSDAVLEADASIGVLLCPSDRYKAVWARHSAKRSYSMPRHQMGTNPAWSFMTSKQAWPPHSADRTGIGLNWQVDGESPDSNDTWNLAQESALPNAKQRLPQQEAITPFILPDAAGTIMITEQAGPDNIQGNDRLAAIIAPESHLNGAHLRPAQFHDGYINYLMVDGHVEHLQPAQTLGRENRDLRMQSGMWTIAADD